MTRTKSRVRDMPLDRADLHAALDAMPAPGLLIAANLIAHANARAARLLGAPAEALVQRTPAEFFAPASGRTSATAQWWAHRPGPDERPIELTLVRSDGTHRTVHASLAPVETGRSPRSVVLLHDVTALARSSRSLHLAEARLLRVSARVAYQNEADRGRMAATLHDGLQQSLAAAQLHLGAITLRPGLDAETTDAMDRVSSLVRKALDCSRLIADDLQPALLHELGLPAALEAMLARFARGSGIGCRFRSRGFDAHRLDVDVATATCLHAVAAEALLNVAEHARASNVDVRLARDRQGSVRLRIRDDGVGLAPEALLDAHAPGLQSMEARVRSLGGRFALHSARGRGLTVEAVVSPPGSSAAGARPTPDVEPDGPHEQLLQFLYRAPVGLVQATLDGDIEMINPAAARMLMPLATDANLLNLVEVLSGALPDLGPTIAAHAAESGTILESVRLGAGASAPWLHLVKRDASHLIAVLSDRDPAPASCDCQARGPAASGTPADV